MEKHTIQLPWDLDTESMSLLVKAIRLAEDVESPIEATVTTPSKTQVIII